MAASGVRLLHAWEWAGDFWQRNGGKGMGTGRLFVFIPLPPFLCPEFPGPTRPHLRTAASRPTRWAFVVRVWGTPIGCFPLCVPSDLCGVPLRATTIGALPENTAEIGRNAEGERVNARTSRGFLPQRGCVRGAPAAADWPPGTPRISTSPSEVSGPLRLVLGGHDRAPSVAASPPCVLRVSVVIFAICDCIDTPERFGPVTLPAGKGLESPYVVSYSAARQRRYSARSSARGQRGRSRVRALKPYSLRIS